MEQHRLEQPGMEPHGTAPQHAKVDHYGRLLIMLLLSFMSMYVLMYAMVDAWTSVYTNLNQAYMAGLMTAPMGVFELLLMRSMYGNRRWNSIILVASVVGGIACFVFIRQQTAIGDQQFLRSMIPHHSGAILMCVEASVRNPAITELCRSIVTSQREEITRMKELLNR